MILLLSLFFFKKLKFITRYPKRFLYFHAIYIYFLIQTVFKGILVLIFIVELHFNSMITCLISVVQRKLLIMMFLMHQALVMIESTHVVGFLNWKNGMSIITAVQMSYDPTDNSYLSLEQLFVIKIVFLQQILFCIKNVYIYVFCYLLVLFVILPTLLILVYGCTLLNLMEV